MRTESGLAAANRVLIMSFGMMVARDGVEPPTPAFSALISICNDLTSLRWLRKSFKVRESSASLGLGSWAGCISHRVVERKSY
jgi:hypothetical protein